MSRPPLLRPRNLVGAAVLAAGVAGGVAVRQAVSGRQARLPPSEDPWPPGTRRHYLRASDGARLHVVERGEGRPLMLLHGITLSADVWAEQIRELPGQGWRVVAMDLRGHGSSDIGEEGLAIDRVTRDVSEVVAALGLRRATLVGHSMGGMVALRMLSTDPILAGGGGWLAALCLVSTSAAPALDRGIPLARLGVAALGVAGRAAALLPGPTLLDDEVADPIAALTFTSDRDASPAQVAMVRRATARVPFRNTAGLLSQLIRLDESAGLAAIRVPTAVLVGRQDLITPPRLARALAGAVRGAELVEVDHCGHMLMLEQPSALARALERLSARTS